MIGLEIDASGFKPDDDVHKKSAHHQHTSHTYNRREQNITIGLAVMYLYTITRSLHLFEEFQADFWLGTTKTDSLLHASVITIIYTYAISEFLFSLTLFNKCRVMFTNGIPELHYLGDDLRDFQLIGLESNFDRNNVRLFRYA